MSEDYTDLDLSDEEVLALEGDDNDQDDDKGDIENDDEPDQDDKGGDEGDADPDDDGDGDADQDDADESDEADTGTEDKQGDPADDAAKADAKADEPDGKTVDDAKPGDSDDVGTGDDPAVSSDYETKIKDLDKKLDDGEIHFDEYKTELRSIERERTRDIVRQEMSYTKAEETWNSEQSTFFADNGYLKTNPVVYDSFAREVNRLLADKAWSNKPGTDVLAEAKKSIDSAFGVQTPKKEENKPVPVSEGKKAVQKAKQSGANKSSPKTLRDIPASDNNTDGAFEHLDSLSGAAYESAIAKLTPAEMEAYENS